MADSSQDFATIIGADAKFKGDLTFSSAAKVLGTVEGSIDSKGTVHIASGSNCKATITAKEVAVEGHVEGNVEASERLDLKPNGMITGDVVAAKMAMAEGASINGYCRIGVNGQAKSGSGSSSSSSTTELKPSSSTGSSSSSTSSSTTATAKK